MRNIVAGGERIRVVHLIDTLHTGGAEKVVMTLAASMNKEKFDIEIWCAKYSNAHKAEMDRFGVTVKTIPLSRFWLLYPLYRLAKRMAKERPLILHTHLFSCDIKGRISGRLAKVPIIISTYHTFYVYKRVKTIRNRIKVLLDNITARLLCDKITVVSRSIADLHIDSGTPRNKLQVIANPVDTNRFKGGSGSNDIESKSLFSSRYPQLVTVARLVPVKGIAFLLCAAPKVLKRYPDTKFMIVGYGRMRRELEQRIGELCLSQSVVLMGERRDVVDILQDADIFVLPSLSEGVPISVLEAMSVGLPVVATEVGGNSDIIVNYETGILVPPGDPDALADAILILLDNEQKAKEMGRRARKRAERLYSIETVVRQTENLYIHLAKSKLLIDEYVWTNKESLGKEGWTST